MRRIALVLTCIAVAGVAATAATARTDTSKLIIVKTGLTAPIWSGLGDPVFQSSQQKTAYQMAHNAGATYARLLVHWAAIAPSPKPASGFNPADPTSKYYHWAALDASVAAANSNGVTPILDIVSPPKWGYSVKPGSWTGGSPNLSALGYFATAIAKHFNGASPSAHVFSVWNEPNFNRNLYPQSESYYLKMVNAVAASVHKVNPADLVGAGELAPYKHTPSKTDKNQVIPPIEFMQKMLCLSTTTPVKRTCSGQAHFDFWAHHPYSDKGPFGKASVSGGVELGDLPKMNSLLQTAWKLGAISSAQHVQFWVTELGWDSNKPNVHGVPLTLLTRWLAESYYQMWKSGVTVGTWFLLQDEASSTPFQSGLYFRSTSTLNKAVVKPIRTPFTFPFVAYLKSGGKVQVWGRDKTGIAEAVSIQQKIGSKSWKTVATITANKYGIFQGTLALGAHTTDSMRAIASDSGTSAAFKLAVPANENMNVVPFPHG
jgi:hypothetical protein